MIFENKICVIKSATGGLNQSFSQQRKHVFYLWPSNSLWDGISHPFPNFNVPTVEVREWKSNIIPGIIMYVINYPRWDWFNLNHVRNKDIGYVLLLCRIVTQVVITVAADNYHLNNVCSSAPIVTSLHGIYEPWHQDNATMDDACEPDGTI